MKAVSGKTTRLVHNSCFGAQDSIENLEQMIEYPIERQQEALRRECLSRDAVDALEQRLIFHRDQLISN